MEEDYGKFLDKIKFDKYLISLKQRLKNKKVIIYGAGLFFQYIIEHYDLSGLDIIGIADKKFERSNKESFFRGYRTIAPQEISNFAPDCILVSVIKPIDLIINLSLQKIFSLKIDILPLVPDKFIHRLFRRSEFYRDDDLCCCLLKNMYYLFRNDLFLRVFVAKKEKDSQTILKKVCNRYNKTLKRLFAKQKYKVLFLCSDSSRWKCQCLYDLLSKDEHFEPIIVVTRLYVQTSNITRQQSIQNLKKQYEFFINKGMNTFYGYDIKNGKYLNLRSFKPDYIFYQLPFFCHPLQRPEYCSKFALTAYIPYYISTSLCESHEDLYFRSLLHRYYLFHEFLKDYYSPLMINNGENIRLTGHPTLDYYIYQKPDTDSAHKKDKLTVIYAPHHSMEENSPIKLSTFMWNGEFILEYAQKHPEIDWIFRPHPLHKKVLATIWGDKKTERYYKEWQEIGIYDHDSDYMDTFKNSSALINDCGFAIEYFPTQHPVIHLLNKGAIPYDIFSEQMLKTCYLTHNIEELKEYMDMLFVKREDPKKQERINFLKNSHIIDSSASQNILGDMKKELNI